MRRQQKRARFYAHRRWLRRNRRALEQLQADLLLGRALEQLQADLLLGGTAISRRVNGEIQRIDPTTVYITTSKGRVTVMVEIAA